ncbi:MAG: hypothetical protein ACKO2Z_12285, partial [Sphaerospermopsis kisseleviana]
MTEQLSGSGGIFGGGSQQTRQQIVDRISGTSNDYVKLLLGICEGTIGGLVNGNRDIYLDKTPLVGADGSLNFRDV